MMKKMSAAANVLMAVSLSLLCVDVFAASTLGGVATQLTASISKVAALVGVGSYVAGLGFAVGAIMKFKQHKDNPTQITVGTPISLVFIAAALLFLPSVMGVMGKTLFGTAKTSGTSGAWSLSG
jgi:intracellular multiplication protein IcmD